MTLTILKRYPRATGIMLALMSLSVGLAALLAAEFGAPGWVFVPLLLWLVTLGLPSTLAVLFAACVWGTTQPLYGLPFFILVATALAVSAHILVLKVISRS